MKRSWLTSIGIAVVLAVVASAQAVEPYTKFVQGLRDRRYYDYAILYLDNLAMRDDVPAEIKQAIPFEKAATLQQSARSLRNLDAKTKKLSQAEALLEQFVKANPLHARAGQANSERARILLGRAEVETWQSRSPSNASKKGEFQKRARQFVTKARKIFKQAHDQHLAKWQSYRTFIDKSDNPQLFRERRDAEIAYIRVQLDLGLCTYAEAQTYDHKAPEFSKFLTQGSQEFEAIFQKYRSMVAGLYARMWQGKCFEEQDEIGKALGIYNELLEHGKQKPGEPPKKRSATMKNLQDKVLQFRLVCLNHDTRTDYKVVIQEASDWIGSGRRQPRTKVGLAIMWERIRAREGLGMKRTLSEPERMKYLNAALVDARYINRWPGEYKDVSTFKIQSLLAALGKDTEDPKDFDTAFGMGRSLVKQIKGFNDAIKDPKNKSKKKELLAERAAHLGETIRIFKLALNLADDKVEMKQVNRARYNLSYMYYLTRQSLKAAILGEFVGRHFDEEDGQMGLDAAYLAMVAYVQAHNDVPKGQSKEFEMRQMAKLANMITTNWPGSDVANEARMRLGHTYSQLKRPVEGAEWYSKVPTSADQYTAAQLAAGQSYWSAYLNAAPLPASDPKKPTNEELQKWRDASQKHLDTGIAKAQTQLPENVTGKEDIFPAYIAAKVSRTQIDISKGEYQAAVDRLTGDPHSVMKAIVVPAGTKRPENGITSQSLAGLAYQLLLRAYVGTQKIDLALKTMDELEKITPDANGVMRIYVQLGRELEKEIERLQKLGQTDRLAEVRTSFEKFLNELYKRKDSMSAGSLTWIAETYYGLAKGLADDQAAATAYFNKAADTYQEIIDNAASRGAKWLNASRIIGVKLRLVNCLRRQGEFEQAQELITDVLSEKANALDAQFEAAYVLQDWADSGQGDSWKKFLDAINGAELKDENKKQVLLWGWAGTANRLQGRMDAGSATKQQELKMYEARYNSIYCRHRFAQAQSSTPKREAALAAAHQELVAFVAISVDVDEQWQEKFNTLSRQILQSMIDAGMKDANGQPVKVVDIEWPKEYVPPPIVVADTFDKPEDEVVVVADTPPEEMPWVAILLGFAVAGGGVYGVYVMMTKQAKAKPVTVYAEMAPILPPQAAQPARRKRVAGKSAAGGSSKPTKKRPVKKKTAGSAARAKPRPKSE